MPEGPSTMTSRTSAAVGPTSPSLPAFPAITRRRVVSDPVLVFPNPRPANRSQIVQSPFGGSWFGRAIFSHGSFFRSRSAAALRFASSHASAAICSSAGEERGSASICIVHLSGELAHHLLEDLGCGDAALLGLLAPAHVHREGQFALHPVHHLLKEAAAGLE